MVKVKPDLFEDGKSIVYYICQDDRRRKKWESAVFACITRAALIKHPPQDGGEPGELK